MHGRWRQGNNVRVNNTDRQTLPGRITLSICVYVCRCCYCFDTALIDLNLSSGGRVHGTMSVVMIILPS